MNKERRKAIDAIIERVSSMQMEAQQLEQDIQELKDQEQEYLDAMPESLQSGDKGTKAEEAINQLENAEQTVAAIDLDEILTALEAAKE